jgi:hypothetical protein
VRFRALLARLPIQAKVTLAYTGLIALMLGAIGGFLYFHFKAGLDHGLNATLSARADDVSALLRHEGARGLERRRDLLTGGELTAQVLGRDGGLVAPVLDVHGARTVRALGSRHAGDSGSLSESSPDGKRKLSPR